MFICFIDLSKAYDLVDRDLLLTKMLKAGIPEHLIIAVARMLNTTSMDVGQGIKTYRGVQQGSVISPALFSIYLVSLLEALKPITLCTLAHADDICFVAKMNLEYCSVRIVLGFSPKRIWGFWAKKEESATS